MESDSEKLQRVRAMADEHDAWDLTENDIAALRYVLARLDQVEGERDVWMRRYNELAEKVEKIGEAMEAPTE